MIFLGALVHFNHLLHADPCIPACSAAVGTPAFFREEPFCRRVGYLVTSESKNCLQNFTWFLVSLNDPMFLFAKLTANTRFCFRAQQGVPCWLWFFFLFSCVVTINAMLLFFNAVGLPRIVFLALGQKRYELVLAGTRKQ